MDYQIKKDSPSSSPLSQFVHVKTEKDQPELINENDLIILCTKTEDDLTYLKNIVRSNKNEESHHCTQCGENFFNYKYLQIHEAIHDPKLHCPVCDKLFKLRKCFTPHIEAHLKNALKCQQCPEVFLDKRSFNLHAFSHKKIKTYSCDYCLKEWLNKKDLTLHIRVHTNERPFTCAVCGKSFKQKGALTFHITNLHSGEKKKIAKKKFDCDICKGSYSSVSSLNKHMKKIHEIGKTFPCRKCGETFLNFQQMKQHKMEAHPELVYNRVCPVCGQKFFCQETFVKHQQLHVGTGQKEDKSCFATLIDCYLCGEQLKGMKAFSKHQQFHLRMTDNEIEECVKAKTFNCKECGKLFKFKNNLFRHMDVHLEKKFECGKHCLEKFTYLGIRLHMEYYFEQFHCTQCSETFIGKKNLKKHYRIHQYTVRFTWTTHWKTQHNLKCHLCLEKFATHLALKKHIRRRHKVKTEIIVPTKQKHSDKINLSVNNVVKYYCKICKCSLATKKLLNNHMKLHKKKCFQCQNCKKNFLYFKNLIFHVKQGICLKYFDNLTGTNQLSCILCKKEFGSVDSLTTHMRCHCTIHKCKFCSTKFKQKDLHEHISQAHPAEARFSCDRCSIRFCSVNELFKHKKYFHRWSLAKGELGENGGEQHQIVKEEIKIEECENIKLDNDQSVWIKEECRE